VAVIARILIIIVSLVLLAPALRLPMLIHAHLSVALSLALARHVRSLYTRLLDALLA
jgi:hypothetical protein